MSILLLIQESPEKREAVSIALACLPELEASPVPNNYVNVTHEIGDVDLELFWKPHYKDWITPTSSQWLVSCQEKNANNSHTQL